MSELDTLVAALRTSRGFRHKRDIGAVLTRQDILTNLQC